MRPPSLYGLIGDPPAFHSELRARLDIEGRPPLSIYGSWGYIDSPVGTYRLYGIVPVGTSQPVGTKDICVVFGTEKLSIDREWAPIYNSQLYMEGGGGGPHRSPLNREGGPAQLLSLWAPHIERGGAYPSAPSIRQEKRDRGGRPYPIECWLPPYRHRQDRARPNVCLPRVYLECLVALYPIGPRLTISIWHLYL